MICVCAFHIECAFPDPSSEILNLLAGRMMRRPGSHALGFVLRVDNHPALGLRIKWDEFIVRRGLYPDDRLFATAAFPDVLLDRCSFIHRIP